MEVSSVGGTVEAHYHRPRDIAFLFTVVVYDGELYAFGGELRKHGRARKVCCCPRCRTFSSLQWPWRLVVVA